GGSTCAVIASNNPDVVVTVVDLNVERIKAWNSEELPIYEPGLLKLVQQARDGARPNLFFSKNMGSAIFEADLIFVCVNTPTKQTGLGAGQALELDYLQAAIKRIAEVAQNDKIIVEKSTVPCRTAETIQGIFSASGRRGVRFTVLSNPEFLAAGTAVADLLHPDRVLIGRSKTPDGYAAAAALADVYAAWIPRDRIVTINLFSSELAKLSANALLAQRISSINSLSAICEATGADIDEVSYACGLDTRIGPSMLKASVGFGGSCFRKDVLSLCYLAESLDLPEVAAYWKGVIDMNEYQKDRFTTNIVSCLGHSLAKKLAVLGFTYKKDTNDTRESAAISIVSNLTAKGASVSIYDPRAKMDQVWRDIDTYVSVSGSAYEACMDAQAVIILTEWDEFSNKPLGGALENAQRSSDNSSGHPSGASDLTGGDASKKSKLDWAFVAKIMCPPKYVFDGRNVVDAGKLTELGFHVECIGKPSMS
ncbi:hypothetical protein H2201_006933, partial [Coniosporium apollinis]